MQKSVISWAHLSKTEQLRAGNFGLKQGPESSIFGYKSATANRQKSKKPAKSGPIETEAWLRFPSPAPSPPFHFTPRIQVEPVFSGLFSHLQKRKLTLLVVCWVGLFWQIPATNRLQFPAENFFQKRACGGCSPGGIHPPVSDN